jgi:hypothetical protein
MKYLLSLILFCIIPALPAKAAVSILVDDFNSTKTVNKLGGNTGCWSCNPKDITQFCDATFVTDPRVGDSGYSLRLEYNQTTPNNYIDGFPNVAYNGYFSLLKQVKLTKMKYLVMNIKGDASAGYTHSLTVQLKNPQQIGNYIINGISDEWQRFVIPLNRFEGITDWYYMKEFVIVFDQNTSRRTGAIYIDDVSFTDSPYPKNSNAKFVKPVGQGPAYVFGGDGSIWRHANVIDISATDDFQSGVINSPKQNFAKISFLWDNDYLYLLANINDPEVVCTKSDGDIKYDDCFELFVETGVANGSRREDEYLHFGFSPSAIDGQPQVWEWLSNTSPPDDEVPMAAKTGQITKGVKGYQIQAAISWKRLNIKPAPGVIVNLCPCVHDYGLKNVSNGTYSWFFLREGEKVTLGELKLEK